MGGVFFWPADVLVHLAGVFAFWVAYPFKFTVRASARWAFWPSEPQSSPSAATRVADCSPLPASLSLCLFAFPRSRTLWRMIMAGVLAMLFLAITATANPGGGSQRAIYLVRSNRLQCVEFVTNTNADLDGTKSWRLYWWHDIVDYTFGGEHFWAGKGFGVNLADADGYQTLEDDGVARSRSPHNGHLTVLACLCHRIGTVDCGSGKPGLMASWLILRRARSAGRSTSGQESVPVVCGRWLADIVTGSFAGVPRSYGWNLVWTVYGVGMSALWLYRLSVL